MNHFYEQYFFSVFSFNNDSSDNKRILSEVNPGFLGHQRLFTGWQPLDTTTLSSFFDVMEILDQLMLNFVEDSFILTKSFSLL